MNEVMLTAITLSCYLAAGILQVLRLQGWLSVSKMQILLLAFIAVITHAVLLHHWIDNQTGQNLSFFNIFSQVLWLIACFVIFTNKSRSAEILSVLIFPVAGISIVLAKCFPSSYVINTVAHPKQLIHILSALIAFSVLGIAALQSVLLAAQEHGLRSKHLARWLDTAPALITMETLLFQMIAFGFILLSLVLVTSLFLFIHDFDQMLQHSIMALLSWGVFAVLLAGRWYLGWRGQTAVRWTLGGMLLLFLSYAGTHAVINF